MSPLAADLVGCWIFRMTAGRLEILLLRRAAGRIYPGIWQCVTGGLEPGERVIEAALREVREETGIGEADIEAFYGLDLVNLFHAEHVDAIQAEAVFAARIRADAEIRLSEEHDAMRWLPAAEALELVLWPAYRTAIGQLEWLAREPEKAAWMQAGAWALPAALLPPFPSR